MIDSYSINKRKKLKNVGDKIIEETNKWFFDGKDYLYKER